MTLVNDLSALYASDSMALLMVFWYALLIEVPRFLIAVLYLGAQEVTLRKLRRPPSSAALAMSRTSTISILLPGHNEGHALEKAIRSLHEQICAPTQIVVVDDGSTDDMATIGCRLKAAGLIDVFLSTGLRGGKAAASNLGLNYCTGDFIVVTDVDTSFDRDALIRLVEPFASPRVGAVSGNLGVRNADATLITRFQAIQYVNSIAMGRRVNDMIYGQFIASGAFAAFRRAALLSIGGWAAGPGEDGDVSTRLWRAGWTISFKADAWAMTDVPETLSTLLRQRARWNRSFAMLRFRKHAQVMNPMQMNFTLANAFRMFDSIFFEAFRPAAFLVYVVWLAHEFGSLMWSILAAVSAMYLLAGFALFVVAAAGSAHYGRLHLLPYLPGAMLFNGFVLRPASVYAFLTELLWRRGYKDNFVPNRVLAQIEHF